VLTPTKYSPLFLSALHLGISPKVGIQGKKSAPEFRHKPKCFKDRGRYEAQIAIRLGDNRWDILLSLSDEELNLLCQRQRDER
jgi:hypothetical protein